MTTRPTSPDRRFAAAAARPLPIPWRVFEGCFRLLCRMETLDGDPDVLFAYNLFAYRGPELALRCGTVVRRGDTVLEVHFRREALLPLMTAGEAAAMGLGLLRLADRDVPRLARALEREPALRRVRALHALTLFHRGIGRYGFEVMPARSRLEERWFTWWHRLLMARDHPAGRAHVRAHAQKLVTRHVWVSREEFIRRFACAPDAGGSAAPGAGPVSAEDGRSGG